MSRHDEKRETEGPAGEVNVDVVIQGKRLILHSLTADVAPSDSFLTHTEVSVSQ